MEKGHIEWLCEVSSPASVNMTTAVTLSQVG